MNRSPSGNRGSSIDANDGRDRYPNSNKSAVSKKKKLLKRCRSSKNNSNQCTQQDEQQTCWLGTSACIQFCSLLCQFWHRDHCPILPLKKMGTKDTMLGLRRSLWESHSAFQSCFSLHEQTQETQALTFSLSVKGPSMHRTLTASQTSQPPAMSICKCQVLITGFHE